MFINTIVLLQSVNKYRTHHCVPDVSWDTTVQKSAQTWADYLASAETFTHSTGVYGENLAMMYDPSLQQDGTNNSIKGIQMWYAEINEYNYNNPGYSSSTGHFTQLVWKGTTSIGVGVA